jgi:hypothetical protein
MLLTVPSRVGFIPTTSMDWAKLRQRKAAGWLKRRQVRPWTGSRGASHHDHDVTTVSYLFVVLS